MSAFVGGAKHWAAETPGILLRGMRGLLVLSDYAGKNLFLDKRGEKAYDFVISCKEFRFGRKTSRKALEAYAAFLLSCWALAPYQCKDERR
jgi:hypothetical protein